jgi:hypothetical protein
MKNTIYLTILLTLLFSCSTKISYKTFQNIGFGIPDSLFALKNICNTDFIDSIYLRNNQLFLDSTRKVKFTEVDSIFKRKIIYPVLINNHEFRKEYLDSFEQSFFISKQQKTGKYQPITLWTFGVDNYCLLLVMVDSALNPVSHIILNGNYGSAFIKIDDKHDYTNEYKHSKIKGDIITTCKISTFYNTNNSKEIYADSIVYKSEILKNGLINTQKTDSVRIKL